ncbi:MAG: creatininase family protein [Armatimonadetes bacterium]|nr:creatininase family protein [Armatimonadota bacterium]
MTTKETHLGMLSSAEAEERLKSRPVILLPFGAQEGHGPHLPLGADYLVAEAIAVRASRQCNALVAPVMPYGYAPHFRNFHGGVSTRPEITQMLAEDLMAGFHRFGCDRFIFVDNHAHNDAPLEVAARAMQDRLGVKLAHFYPWRVMTAWGPELFGDRWASSFGHGAEPNNSVMLYLWPERYLKDRAVKGGMRPLGGLKLTSSRTASLDAVTIGLYFDIDQVNDTGVTGGDPSVADAKIGEILVDRTAAALAKLVGWIEKLPAEDSRRRR